MKESINNKKFNANRRQTLNQRLMIDSVHGATNTNMNKASIQDVSASRCNLFSLNKAIIKMYLSIKRFNNENKDTNLVNFYNELKYSLYILMNFKDIVDFIYQLLKLRSITDIDKDIRLYLHTYFNCEFTIVLNLPNPYSLDDNTKVVGLTSQTQELDMIMGEIGSNMQKLIREKRIISHQVDETSSVKDFSHAIYRHLNIHIDNYAAYPVVIDDVVQYIIVLCNRKPQDESW